MPLLIYFGNIGWDINNLAELEGLWQGLLIAKKHNYHPREVEVNSMLLINMAKILLSGSHARKITMSWRLEARLEAIEHELLNNRAIIFSHVKREGNKVSNLLANVGVESIHTLLTGTLDIIRIMIKKRNAISWFKQRPHPRMQVNQVAISVMGLGWVKPPASQVHRT